MTGLDSTTLKLLGYLRAQTMARYSVNKKSESYYDASIVLQNLNIAVPPTLSDIGVASDWPSTIVDAYHERLVFEGWTSDAFGMSEISEMSRSQVAVMEATLDAGVYGVGFLAVESTFTDEWSAGDWCLKSISPLDGTLLWDYGTDRPLAGYRKVPVSYGSDSHSYYEVLYLPWKNIILKSSYDSGSPPEVVQVQETRCPRPAVARVRSKMRSQKYYGESMITPPVRYYTDAAMRTLLGMEINREFYTTPQRWVLNADMSIFTQSDNPTQDERADAGWKATSGRVLALPPPEQGYPEMKVGSFSSAPPTPYVEQLRCYSQLVASATGMPSSYLGFTSENPPSADAIRAWLERLVRSVVRQQRLISPDLREIAWVLHTVMSGSRVEWVDFRHKVNEKWENPATETLAADVDAVSKAIGAGAVTGTCDWTYDKLRIPESQRAALRAEVKAQDAAKTLAMLLEKRGSEVGKEAATVADSFGKPGKL